MHYTIAELNEVHGNLKLNFDKIGNQYLVGIYNTNTKEYTHRTFDRRQQALKKFSDLSIMIIEGLHSEQRKREFLQED